MIRNFLSHTDGFAFGIIAKLQGSLTLLNTLSQNVFVFNEVFKVGFQPDNVVENQ